MKPVLVGVGLSMLQLYFTLWGEAVFDKYWNAVLLFIVSVTIPVYLIWLILRHYNSVNSTQKKGGGVGFYGL